MTSIQNHETSYESGLAPYIHDKGRGRWKNPADFVFACVNNAFGTMHFSGMVFMIFYDKNNMCEFCQFNLFLFIYISTFQFWDSFIICYALECLSLPSSLYKVFWASSPAVDIYLFSAQHRSLKDSDTTYSSSTLWCLHMWRCSLRSLCFTRLHLLLAFRILQSVGTILGTNLAARRSSTMKRVLWLMTMSYLSGNMTDSCFIVIYHHCSILSEYIEQF